MVYRRILFDVMVVSLFELVVPLSVTNKILEMVSSL